ncbi:hypothetical protein [Niabella hirudinis]|uniref:hypothetical protein n=1 Tax=Niabella hirudinis TaxID=1285929 RepID=UPI003EC140A6
MDTAFFQSKAYPYLHDAAIFIENITEAKDNKRMQPLSSSPEYINNNVNAWFPDWTNFDLVLVKFLFKAASEIAMACNKKEEAKDWLDILEQLPAPADHGHFHRHFPTKIDI